MAHVGVRPGTWYWSSGIFEGGDVRRMDMALRWRQRQFGALGTKSSSVPYFENAFDAARKLITRRTSAASWADQAQEWDLPLLQYHVPGLTPTCAMQDLFCDTLSAIDSCRPSRFDGTLRNEALHAAALVTQITSHARDAGALRPPPNPKSLRQTAGTGSYGAAHHYRLPPDVPSLLGGPSFHGSL